MKFQKVSYHFFKDSLTLMFYFSKVLCLIKFQFTMYQVLRISFTFSLFLILETKHLNFCKVLMIPEGGRTRMKILISIFYASVITYSQAQVYQNLNFYSQLILFAQAYTFNNKLEIASFFILSPNNFSPTFYIKISI